MKIGHLVIRLVLFLRLSRKLVLAQLMVDGLGTYKECSLSYHFSQLAEKFKNLRQ